MRRLTASEVKECQVAQLGLDPNALKLTSVEAVAASLRRAARLLCPCESATLVSSVVDPLRGLAEDLPGVRVLAQETLKAIIWTGDLIEHGDIEEGATPGAVSLLYAAPVSFVARESGSAILLGIPPSQSSGLPRDLAERIEYTGHIRRLRSVLGEDLGAELRQLGFIEIPSHHWLKVPPRQSPEQHTS